MSKSLGNIINPLDMIEKYGADAARLSLIIGTGPGNDSKLSEDKVRGYKYFTNKVWNASRFVLENAGDADLSEKPDLSETEKDYLKELGDLTREVSDDIENYRFYLAGEKLYHYFWHRFADIIIEAEKKRIKEGNEAEKAGARFVLKQILLTLLKLLHPFIPFVTEKIWSAFPEHKGRLLMIESWPR